MVSLIQTYILPAEFNNLFFWLCVGSLHYSLIWGIVRNPSNKLNFLLLTKVFKGGSYCSVEKYF